MKARSAGTLFLRMTQINHFGHICETNTQGIFLMFETKNTNHIETEHINQTATYLGDKIGRIGFIATRMPLQSSQERKIFSIYNDNQPRKIILVISDKDFEVMLDMKCQQRDPMRYLQKMYRSFRTRVQ